MRTTPKGYYTRIRREIEMQVRVAEAFGLHIPTDAAVEMFRAEAYQGRRVAARRRRTRRVERTQPILGTLGLLLAFGSVGGLSQGTLAEIPACLVILAGCAIFTAAVKLKAWLG